MEEKRAKEILESFPQKKILVIGDFCLDEYIFGETDELSPEFPVLRLFIKEKKYVPGAAGNVASGIRALEAQTFAVGIIGNDENGSILLHSYSSLSSPPGIKQRRLWAEDVSEGTPGRIQTRSS